MKPFDNYKFKFMIGVNILLLLGACQSPKITNFKKDSYGVYDEKGSLTREGRNATAKIGMVSAAKAEASEIGRNILKKGGNAIDAAIATGFALSVIEPMSSGIGGGGFMTIRNQEGETFFIDFREIAPKRATADMWVLDADGKVIGDEKKLGGKSVGVPGEVYGFCYALENFGTMSLQEVLKPAIKLAEKGFIVSSTLNSDITNQFDKISTCEETKALLFNNHLPYQTGELLKNPNLAKTLNTIAKKGRKGFYEGEIAENIIRTIQDANGVMELSDLQEYEPRISKPIQGTYRGYEIISSPPPSSGGTTVIEILNILENFDLANLEINSPEYIHLFSEAFKLAYADRAEYLGDTKFVDVPLQGLLDKKYATRLSKKIDPHASQNYHYDDPWSFEHEDTTHFSVADQEGNMVAVTKTINGIFGSGLTAYDTGIILNNEMDDFDTGHGKANSVMPGKKPLSSMSPTLILKDNKPVAVIGTPGGTRIITTVVQIISHIIDHGMDIQEAINLPRFADTGKGNLSIESRIDEYTQQKLKELGHELDVDNEYSRSFGSVHAIQYTDQEIRGGADPRKDGKAFGY